MRGRPAGLERERSEGGAPGRPPLHGSRTLRGSRSRSNTPLPPDGRAARARLGTASTLPISDVGNQGEDWGAENGIGGAGGVERTEGERTVVWHNGPEGFSTYVFSFACALSFAQATNRTLLLAPVQPAHADDRFKFPDLYMDELLQVPSALKTVRIKHLTPRFILLLSSCLRKTRPRAAAPLRGVQGAQLASECMATAPSNRMATSNAQAGSVKRSWNIQHVNSNWGALLALKCPGRDLWRQVRARMAAPRTCRSHRDTSQPVRRTCHSLARARCDRSFTTCSPTVHYCPLSKQEVRGRQMGSTGMVGSNFGSCI